MIFIPMNEEKLDWFENAFWALFLSMGVFIGCGKSEEPVSEPKGEGVNMLQLARQPDGHMILRSSGEPFTGIQQEQWPDGQPRLEYSFVDGWRDGLSRSWHANGQLGLQGKWTKGNPIGKVEEWSPDGLLKRTMVYRDGQVISDTTEASEMAQIRIDAELKERERWIRRTGKARCWRRILSAPLFIFGIV